MGLLVVVVVFLTTPMNAVCTQCVGCFWEVQYVNLMVSSFGFFKTCYYSTKVSHLMSINANQCRIF